MSVVLCICALRWLQSCDWIERTLAISHRAISSLAFGSTMHKGVPKHMVSKIMANSGDFQTYPFWCTSNVGTRLGGSLAPKAYQTDGFKMASSGDFQNWQSWCASSFWYTFRVFPIENNTSHFISAPDRHPSEAAHLDRTPCQGLTLGRFLDDVGQFRSRATENRPPPPTPSQPSLNSSPPPPFQPPRTQITKAPFEKPPLTYQIPPPRISQKMTQKLQFGPPRACPENCPKITFKKYTKSPIS